MQHYTFPNGLRLIHEQRRSADACALQVWVDFGSAHETDLLRGAAHFIEHMCFKGTPKYAVAQIFQEQLEMGNHFNASTTQRYTVYHSKITASDLTKALPLLSSMLLESTFPKKDCVKEERVIVEECLDQTDEALVEEESIKLLYAGTPFEFPIDSKTYHPLDLRAMTDIYKAVYHPGNMLISIVSPMPWKTILGAVGQSGLALAKNKHILKPGFSPIQTKSVELRKTSSSSKTAHIRISFRTCNQEHPDRFALDLLQHVVGGMGGTLFVWLRGKHGITYKSRCDTENNEFGGHIAFYAQVEKAETKQVLRLLHEFIQDLVHHGVKAKELLVAKRSKKAQLGLTDVVDHAEYNGREWLTHGQVPDVPLSGLFEARYKNITRKQIHDVCRTYLLFEKQVTCVVGPKS
jgi:predicted Zn-dependent peptidase